MRNWKVKQRVRNSLLDKALLKVTAHNRTDTGHWLACQLRDSGCTEAEAGGAMMDYASQIHGNGTELYTRAEAMATLKSAFSKPARTKGIETLVKGEL
jgi:putative DNA primase/helicase